MRTPAINLSLERTISRDRLKKYLEETTNDLDASIHLYERNTRLSEAMYTPLQSLEICLRNSISHEMARVYGDNWLINKAPPFSEYATKEIAACGEGRTIGDLIAELKFSFWVSLIGPGYDATLWRTAIHKAFRAKGSKKRQQVHSRLNALRRFRNRVAHHEPIFMSASQFHAECLEAISWMSLDTYTWTAYHSRFLRVNEAD